MAPSPNITELDRHLRGVLAQLPHYRNKSRLEDDARRVMRVHPGDVALHEVSRSVLNGLASIAGLGSVTQPSQSARAGSSAQLGGTAGGTAGASAQPPEAVLPLPMKPTVESPWSLVPEVVKWGNTDWFRFTGKLSLYSPQMAARDAQRPNTGASGVLNTLASAPTGRSVAVAASLIKQAAGDTSGGPPELVSALKVKIHLWLPESYPEGYPLLYIFAGKHSRLVPHPHVDVQGRVYLPAISSWNPQMNPTHILHEAVQIFATQPPVVSTLLENSAAIAAKKAKVAAGVAFKFAKGLIAAASTASAAVGSAASAASGGPGSSQYENNRSSNSSNAATPAGPVAPPSAAPAQIEPQVADPSRDKDTVATEPGTECVVCLSNKKAAFFLPCGHVSCCMECGRGMKECCLCRAPIQQVFKAYI